ncbi:MAG: hypothetical protein HKN49_13885 [Gammaproteobacteria bacterium]|nr:hypothetical protein [Gammaproteobacteria bacterium]
MKTLPITLFALLTMSMHSFAAEGGDERKSCMDFEGKGFKNILPVVIKLPLFVNDRRKDDVHSCIAIVYGLKNSRRYKGSLLPREPRVVATSADVSVKDAMAVQKAFRGWHFQKKKHSPSKEPIYYSVIEF